MIRFISSEEKEKTGMLWKKGAIKTLSAVMLVSPMVALVPTAVQAMPITGAVPTTGNGTYNSPYIITTPQELYYMNTLRTGYYKLGANIDLSNYEWSPISSFAGMLDGAGHYIKNLNISQYNADAGLFSTLATGGVVRNLGILYANIAIPSAGQVNIRAGIIAGTNQGTIQNSHVSGRVNISGIRNSYINTITMDGGLVGLNAQGGMITNTLAQVDVAQSGSSFYDYGKVGGLAGRNDGSISNSYFVGTVVDQVTSPIDYYNPGGSVGFGSSSSVIATFWDSTIGGSLNNGAGGTPKSTAEMKSQQNYSGWDFTNVWSIQEGVTYPFLRNYQPTVQAIPDKAINIADGSYSIDLTSSFTDPAGDPLTITAVSSNTTVLTAQVSGNQLLLTPVAHGTVTVTAKAVNSQGAIVTDSFVVTVASAGLVTGIVQGPGNTPISGASVSIGGISDITDAQGHFTLSNIPPGSQTVTVSSVGYNNGTAAVTVTVGQSVSAGTITLTPVQTTGSVTGVIYGPGNTPISGASVSIGGISDITDAQGHFTLSNIPPGSQTVTVSSVGYNNGTADVTVTVGQSVSAGTITLTPVQTTGSVTGGVYGPGNTPISGASVSIGGISDVTDAQGQFTLSNIPPGSQTVTVSSVGYNNGTAAVTVTVGQSVSAGTITLTPVQTTGSVTGIVQGLGNTPISGASVSIGGISDITDVQGQFTLSNIPPGSQTVTVSSAGYNDGLATVTVTAGQSVSVGTISLTAVTVTPPTTPPTPTPTTPPTTPPTPTPTTPPATPIPTPTPTTPPATPIPTPTPTTPPATPIPTPTPTTPPATPIPTPTPTTPPATPIPTPTPTTPPATPIPTPTPTTPPATPIPTPTPTTPPATPIPTPTPTTPPATPIPTPTPTTPPATPIPTPTPTTPPATPIPTPTPTTPPATPIPTPTPTTPPATPIPTPTPTTPPATPIPTPTPTTPPATPIPTPTPTTPPATPIPTPTPTTPPATPIPTPTPTTPPATPIPTPTPTTPPATPIPTPTPTTPPTTPIPTPTPTTPPTTPTPAPAGANVFNSGIVDTTKLISFLENKVELASQSSAPLQFSDAKGHWAEQTITAFVKLGAIQGNGSGDFVPNGNITRTEFAIILARVFNIQTGTAVSSPSFTDITGHWGSDAILKLAQAGVVKGYADSTFRPDQSISREEMVVILTRILNLDSISKDSTKGGFTDLSNSFAGKEIEVAAQVGMINGKSIGKFDPKSSTTRAEALTTIMNALSLDPQVKNLLDSLK
ncbi:carboxypeptidase regulatory-like domain-containing protein [Paenibacillus sp. sgz5001063]|uniref:carboxypeptidase regulatory-like domain-containing protein n=1 Tax=Paenibacillus sp. sgz5001063 TaxID=3242474 RepID=UPI0036D3CD14